MCYILQYGETALHYATSYGYLELVTLLINNGCNVNIANKVSHKVSHI